MDITQGKKCVVDATIPKFAMTNCKKEFALNEFSRFSTLYSFIENIYI